MALNPTSRSVILSPGWFSIELMRTINKLTQLCIQVQVNLVLGGNSGIDLHAIH